MRIRVTESQLKRMAPQINEQGVIKMIKNLISPEVKGVQSTMRGNLNLSSAMTNLMKNYGRVKMTDYVRSLLRPVQDEITILKNDIGRLQQFRVEPVKVPGKLPTDHFIYLVKQINYLDDMVKNTPKGQVIDFGVLHAETENLIRILNDLIVSKQLSKQSYGMLKSMQQNIKDALSKTENVVSQIATKR